MFVRRTYRQNPQLPKTSKRLAGDTRALINRLTARPIHVARRRLPVWPDSAHPGLVRGLWKQRLFQRRVYQISRFA